MKIKAASMPAYLLSVAASVVMRRVSVALNACLAAAIDHQFIKDKQFHKQLFFI
ncbi:hypothetical protein FCM35_KLT00207 [Carex littledalei]|uniref:Uncharacterized protein n=1 Tax=Carex littledalei TaxID=544730 RepID=A0A833S138_9POAL|nr:hypothetical protein FCM35_KLT00207 [Carex littledalei]